MAQRDLTLLFTHAQKRGFNMNNYGQLIIKRNTYIKLLADYRKRYQKAQRTLNTENKTYLSHMIAMLSEQLAIIQNTILNYDKM